MDTCAGGALEMVTGSLIKEVRLRGSGCDRRLVGRRGELLLQVLDFGGKLLHGVDQDKRQRRGIEDSQIVKRRIVRYVYALDGFGKDRLDLLRKHANAGPASRRACASVVSKAHRPHLAQLGSAQIEIAH